MKWTIFEFFTLQWNFFEYLAIKIVDVGPFASADIGFQNLYAHVPLEDMGIKKILYRVADFKLGT